MKTIEDLNLSNKTVLIRCDFNVPMNAEGAIADDHRIQASLPTIKYAIEHAGKVVLCSHMGRPKGKREPSLSLKPVADRVSQLLSRNITFLDDCVGEKINDAVKSAKSGDVILLENVRYYNEDEANDPDFSKKLGSLCDVFINDAFATAHRAHASTVGVTEFVKEKAAGFTVRDEVEYFNRACHSPAHPLLAIFGGAKVSTKIQAIKNVGKVADMVILGGAMANTFFAAEGLSVGKSLYEKDLLNVATETKKWFEDNDKQLLLPIDVVIAESLSSGVKTEVVDIDKIPENMMALDIGPKTTKLFSDAIKKSKTIVWNGPMGAFETKEFSEGTFALIDNLIEAEALTVVGGGDTDLALNQKNAFDRMDFVSTAGGAFLEMLEGKILPAVKALES